MKKLIMLFGENCPTCEAMKPIFKDFVDTNNIDNEVLNALESKYRTMSIPTFIIEENGEEVKRAYGKINLNEFYDIGGKN